MTAPGPYRVETTPEGEGLVVDRDGRLLAVLHAPDEGTARLLAAAWDLRRAHELDRDGPRLLSYTASVVEEARPGHPAAEALRRRARLAAEAASLLQPTVPVLPVPEEPWRVRRGWLWRLRRRLFR